MAETWKSVIQVNALVLYTVEMKEEYDVYRVTRLGQVAVMLNVEHRAPSPQLTVVSYKADQRSRQQTSNHVT